MNAKSNVIKNANQIVTDHLLKLFIEEVGFFYQVVPFGDQFIVYTKEQSICVIDASGNKTPESLLEKFCFLFTDKNNILCEVLVEKRRNIETLVLKLQDGSVYFMQDFSKLFVKL